MAEKSETCCGSKEKLIKATFDLLMSKGYESTGINEILTNSGVTKSNFYYHFESKEELCLRTLDYIEQYFFENVVNKTLLNSILTPGERLKQYLEFSLKRMESTCCEKGCPFINLGNETSDFYPAFQEKLSRINNRHLQAIESCLEAGVASGDFRESLDPKATALFILAEMNGSMILCKVFKSLEVLRTNVDSLMKMVSR